MSVTEVLESVGNDVPRRRPRAAFTVDDGYSDFAEIAAPIFNDFGCPVTVFLTTESVSSGGWMWWDRIEYALFRSKRQYVGIFVDGREERLDLRTDALKRRACETLVELLKACGDTTRLKIAEAIGTLVDVEIPSRPPMTHRPLSWEQVAELESDSVRFGPHSVSHPILSRVSDQKARAEIVGSWRAVQDHCQRPEAVFCYPNGTPDSFTVRDENIIAEAGLKGALSFSPHRQPASTVHSLADDPALLYHFPRVAFPADPWLTALVAAGRLS